VVFNGRLRQPGEGEPLLSAASGGVNTYSGQWFTVVSAELKTSKLSKRWNRLIGTGLHMTLKQLLLPLLAVTLVACNLVNTLVQLTEQQSRQTDTLTYRNERYNFELDYPANWLLHDQVSMTTFTTFEPGSLAVIEGIPPDQTKIDFLHPTMMQAPSFEVFISESIRNETCTVGAPILFTVDSGGQAVEIIADSPMGGRHSVTYVNLEGRYFMFVAFGNLNPVRNIVLSLRPIRPSVQPYRYRFNLQDVVLPENQCAVQ
jgi:hypothetical protein